MAQRGKEQANGDCYRLMPNCIPTIVMVAVALKHEQGRHSQKLRTKKQKATLLLVKS
jgi:hypothetical protein